MLKRLLTVVLALMLVGGLAGIASAQDCAMDIDVDLDIALHLEDNLVEVDDNNIFALCQDGYRNKVGLVHQFNGGNLLVINQTGCRTSVDFVWQSNTASATGYNIATICQDGYRNRVGAVIQVR